ncbi:MAG TPA: hypothetical protein V6D06_10470, partial [Trichocoleus sp.]
MSQSRPSLFSLMPRSLLVLVLTLLSSSVAPEALGITGLSAQEPLLAQRVTLQERAELEQLQQEADVAFSRATTLFVVLLGTLVLLIAIGMAMLWLMRRSVIQEVSVVVRMQLE